MEKEKVSKLSPIIIGLIMMVSAPLIGNFVEPYSVPFDHTRSYLSFIIYTLFFSMIGLGILIFGIIGYYNKDDKQKR